MAGSDLDDICTDNSLFPCILDIETSTLALPTYFDDDDNFCITSPNPQCIDTTPPTHTRPQLLSPCDLVNQQYSMIDNSNVQYYGNSMIASTKESNNELNHVLADNGTCYNNIDNNSLSTFMTEPSVDSDINLSFSSTDNSFTAGIQNSLIDAIHEEIQDALTSNDVLIDSNSESVQNLSRQLVLDNESFTREHCEANSNSKTSQNSSRQIIDDIETSATKQCETIHAMKKKYRCPMCIEEFSYERNLENHMLNMHCFVCYGIYRCNDEMTEHILTHVNTVSYICPVCCKAFSESYNLFKHVKLHVGKKPYFCILCENQFSFSSRLKNHIRSHTVEKPYHCNLCNLHFAQSTELAEHHKTHKERSFIEEEPYIFKSTRCPICDRDCHDASTLSMHMRTHARSKPYFCTVGSCDESFQDSSSLSSHMSIHAGEKTYTCKTCQKSFALASTLRVHLRTHTGRKPYNCTVCKKCFKISVMGS